MPWALKNVNQEHKIERRENLNHNDYIVTCHMHGRKVFLIIFDINQEL